MIENKTTDAILEKKLSVTINGKAYEVAPPSMATLMLVSKELSVLPKQKLTEEVFYEAFKNAIHGTAIARAFATVVLGAKKVEKKQSIIGKFLGKSTPFEKLTKEVLHSEIAELLKHYLKVMNTMQVQDFFMLITFLTEINLTKPTKKVIETTASGR